MLAALADDLDSPRALAAVQAWVDATLADPDLATDPTAPALMRDVVDAGLGIAL